ncbi:hypothetical protein ACROYT_G006719 [Oculina patagonica]
MACSSPATLSTKETTNYARLCRLLVDVGTQALRGTFDAIHPPANLHTVLAGNKTTLQTLRTRKIINPTQWGKLFPAIPNSVSSRDFDITLLMVLLRNICGLPSPATGWDTFPALTDVSREADIARVKYFRNTVYAHAEHASVDDATFNTYWQDIRDTLVRLGGVQYRAAIDNLETECMDPEIEDHYKELLSQWKKDEDNVKDQLNEIGSEIRNVRKKLDALTASSFASRKEIGFEGFKLEELERMNRPIMCGEEYHEHEQLEYYCRECQICICNKCALITHHRHTIVKTQLAADESKVLMEEFLQNVKTQIDDFEKQMRKGTEFLKSTREDIALARKNARTTAEQVIRVVKEHEMAIMAELDALDDEQQRSHAMQQEQFRLLVTQLKSNVEYCEAILKRNNSLEILQKQQSAVERCQRLLNVEKMNIYRPWHVSYVTNEGAIQTVLQTLPGQVIVSFTNSLQSVAEGKAFEGGDVGRETDFAIVTKDFEGRMCYYKNDQVAVTVKTPLGEDLEKTIENKQDGRYIVHFTPNCPGQHHVIMAVNGQPLTGSPWSVQVSAHQYKHVYQFGSGGTGRGQFDDPFDIAVCNKTGNIAVADCQNNRVQLFTSDGNFLREFGHKGDGSERLNEPFSVAFTRSGEIVVVHSGTISVFTESCQFIKHITNDRLKSPWALSIARNDCMIVCDSGDKAVKVLSPDGAEVLQSFSAPDCDESPWFAVFHQDMFFVSYDGVHCVKAFSKEGLFLYDIGSEGPRARQLKGPFGFAVDRFNNLIVCDYDNQRLRAFTLDGEFVNEVGQQLTKHVVPWSVAISKNGQLLVTDPADNCVHVFE